MHREMTPFYQHGLLLSALFMVTSGCRDATPVTVTASQEEDAVLPCFNAGGNDPNSCYRVKWTKCDQMKVILTRPQRPNTKDADRVKWEEDGKGQMSLFLSKVQKSDEGLYSCEIWQGWDCIIVKNISLKVKECKALQAVKVAPSRRANLTCPVEMSSGQQGPLEVSWVRLKGGNPVSVTSTGENNGTSFDIQSVKNADSGWYRCKYTLGQTQRCFEIYLQVQVEDAVVAQTVPVSAQAPTAGKQGSSGTFITVVTSAIFAIGIIAALIALFMYRRRTTQRVAQQTQRRPAGNHVQSVDGYEIVDFMHSENSMDQRINSIYKGFSEDESMCTFQI